MSERYCHFPLCALAFGTDIKERLWAILAYSIVKDDYKPLAQFAKKWEKRHGSDATVRIDAQWVIEAKYDKFSYDELAVLVAIYSKIGSKKGPVRITQDEIWRRSLGYKSERVFREETGGSGVCCRPRQVRTIIERLDERNFFARITFARRQTFYSHRLSREKLAELVRATKLYRARARQARISANAKLTSEIQAERRKLADGNAAEGATGTPPKPPEARH